MLDRIRLERVLNLQEKSYALLRWVSATLVGGKLSFAVAHDAMDTGEAAEEWIGRHLSNIPPNARPATGEATEFARLFASYLATSFELDKPATRLQTYDGCWCGYCAYLQAGPRLRARNPSKKANRMAAELKKIYLRDLAAELKLGLGYVELQLRGAAIGADPALRKDLAMATWSAELLRRAEFASQGEGVLALWREFAWQDGRVVRDFKLTAEHACRAEVSMLCALRSA
jgi:hypothetical protein